MAYKFTLDTAILSGAVKYANMCDHDPGIGRKSTLLPKLFPPGYLGTKLINQEGATRHLKIGTFMVTVVLTFTFSGQLLITSNREGSLSKLYQRALDYEFQTMITTNELKNSPGKRTIKSF